MPHFYERYFSLDLKKSADFGPSKEVYTLKCRLVSYGAVKDTRNLLLTPGVTERKNFTQWASLNEMLQDANVLIFSFDDLRAFFPAPDLESLVESIKKRSVELKKICQLFISSRDFYSIEELDLWLDNVLNLKPSEEQLTAERVLEKLGRLVIGFDPGLRKSIVSLLSPVYPRIADWLDSLKEKKRELPQKLADEFPLHFLKFKEDNPIENDPDPVEQIFADGGRLAGLIEDYEYRPEQAKMARMFMRAIKNDEFFVAEAGTGTGKSLAYLVPAILYASSKGHKVVAATYTKTLQSQLLFNDLPLAAGACGRQLTAALLKGRNNYLCLLKKAILKSRASSEVLQEDYFSLARVEIWESLTKSGDLAELGLDNPVVLRDIYADANFCLKQACQFYNKCYFFKARKQASRAMLTIVNQALFFTDVLAEGSIIGNRNLAIFDEAHRLEKTATSHLGGELDRFYPLSVMNELYLQREKEQSILFRVQNMVERIVKEEEDFPFYLFKQLREGAEGARSDLDELFRDIKNFRQEKGFRAETFSFKKIFKARGQFHSRILQPLEELRVSMQKLVSGLGDLYNAVSSLELEQNSQIIAEELNRVSGQLTEIYRHVDTIYDCDSEHYVFWLEISERGFSKIAYAPLDVGPQLEAMIYKRYSSILFTSASLSVEGYFDFFERSVGLNLLPEGKVIRKSFGSSFDFFSQIDFFCPVYLPSPKTDYYSRSLASFISKILPAIRKKSLVLCTSIQLLADLYHHTGNNLRSSGFEVLGQSISGNPEYVLSTFKKSPLGVIFGTDSFWEGIDLPGTQLEVLLITRLPFATPTDPIEAARMEQIQKAGKDSFVTYSIPNAVLKFKQGFGRLIRQKTDTGIIIVTDNRLIKSNYGQIFLNSLPTELNVIYSQDEFLDRLRSIQA
ncbi:MAG TPA: hypothetical protein ENO22_06555 [candidate division Zixibacteria bacterium]|nr:hypothetical protein [candidate division Zixibacteria bacterium]